MAKDWDELSHAVIVVMIEVEMPTTTMMMMAWVRAKMILSVEQRRRSSWHPMQDAQRCSRRS